jgi:gluconolactonase
MPQPEIPIERFSIFASGLDHPECITFDREGNLWAGGEAGQIYRIDPTGKVETIAELGGFTGGLAFSPLDQTLYVCNPAHGVIKVSPDGDAAVFATGIGTYKMICPNFLVFDRQGRLYVTDSGVWKKQNGALLRFDPDGSGKVISGPYGYANGLALTADERTLFMTESNTDRVLRLDVNADGTVGKAEGYTEQVGRLTDGLTLDEAGNLYAGCYASDEIWRISPTRQKTLLGWDHFAILIGRPTNFAWGGPERDVLYIANLGRYTIARVALTGVRGQKLAHQN